MPFGKAGEIRGFGSVGHYIQGPKAIEQLPDITARLGSPVMMLLDPYFAEEAKRFQDMFEKAGVESIFHIFEGECSDPELQKLEEQVRDSDKEIKTLIGFGGGKTLDTVRVSAVRMGLKMIIIPTSAASNAATSGLSVVYDENHIGRSEFLYRNPDYVLVDTEYLITAPARLLAAGIGDSLATYIEARANWDVNNINTVMPGYRATLAGKAIARVCFDTLLEKGEEALEAVKKQERTEAFEDVIEAINLLSGIGWENNGCAITHGLAAAIPVIKDTAKMLHGECVAFCILVQLMLENRDKSELETIYSFFRRIGLPVSLRGLGILEDKEDKAMKIAAYALATQSIMKIAEFEMSEEKVADAIQLVDTLAEDEM